MRLFGAYKPEPLVWTRRLVLRAPSLADFEPWAKLRRESHEFLRPWEPVWTPDALSARNFRRRVEWARRGVGRGTAWPLLLFRVEDGALIGGVTLDNVRRGVARTGTLGYWIGEPHARQGYMTEAISGLRDLAFTQLGLTRVEAACLAENAASRALLRRCDFAEEGVLRAHLLISGTWRDHVLHAALAPERRDGAMDATIRRL